MEEGRRTGAGGGGRGGGLERRSVPVRPHRVKIDFPITFYLKFSHCQEIFLLSHDS